MAATSFHQETGRWLTSFRYGGGQEPGAEHTLSIGHPLKGGEFTTYRLGAIVAKDDDGTPLFDLDDAEILIGGNAWSKDGQVWATSAEIREAIEAANRRTYPECKQLELKGVGFRKGVFGQWRLDQ